MIGLRPIRSDRRDAGMAATRFPTAMTARKARIVDDVDFSSSPWTWLRYVWARLTRIDPPIRKKRRDARSQTYERSRRMSVPQASPAMDSQDRPPRDTGWGPG